MKFISFLVTLVVLVTSCKSPNDQDLNTETSSKITTLYLIRHAEKDTTTGSDPLLTEQGEYRANQWVNYFFLKDVDHIISSDFKRTRATAMPLATAKKLPVESYDVSTVTGKDLYKKYEGKTVVLFGHSNTIGSYANDLQVDESFKDLDESDYNTFYIVRIDKTGNGHASKESMDFME